jgi:hypothetical protein
MNDPTEGIRDIFWRGDRIVWENLFKHYLVCLNTAWALLAVCGEDHPFDWKNIPIDYLHGRSLTSEQEKIHAEIFRDFFKPRNVQNYVKLLSNRTKSIRRNELAAHLHDLHLYAIATIHEYYQRSRPVAKQPVPHRVKLMLKAALSLQNKSLRGIGRLEAAVPDNEYAAEIYYTKRRVMTDQMSFIHLYNETIDPSRKNAQFVFVDFPESYVNQIERLVHPEWYAACFMTNCSNSSIWGNYGTNHAGVYLRFKTETKPKGDPFIRLNRKVGIAGPGPAGSPVDVHGPVDHRFYRIDYERPLVPIDFFRSIARVPVPMLRRYWYRDDTGNERPVRGRDVQERGRVAGAALGKLPSKRHPQIRRLEV